MKALIAALLLLPSLVLAQDVSDLPAGTTTTAEDARAYFAGTGAPQAISTWTYLNCSGLASTALTRCHQAVAGIYDSTSSMLVRIVALIDQNSAGGWVKAAATDEYVAYLVLPREQFIRLKGCAADATCSQNGRFKVFAGTWADVSQMARCPDFFPAFATSSGTFSPCAQPVPPAVFYGVSP